MEKYRKWEIPHIQRKLENDVDFNGVPLTFEKRERMKTQITLLHQRRQQIMKEAKRHALIIYLYMVYQTQSSYSSWDSIGGISTKGAIGALAQAITYLPKQKDFYDIFTTWARDLKTQGLLPYYEETIPV